MARKPRIEFEGAFYHVITRGNQRQKVFRDKGDYLRYLDILLNYKIRYDFSLYAYVLMSNHVHLLIETKEIPLSKILQGISLSYTLYFNRKYRTVGHLFQGRYKAILCDKDAYLLSLIKYIHQNPVRARIVKTIESYPWTSHRHYVGRVGDEGFVDKDQALRMFSEDKGKAKRLYRVYMGGGGGAQKEDIYATVDQRVLGDERFVENVMGKTRGKQLRGKRRHEYTLAEIGEAVEELYGITLGSLRGKGRDEEMQSGRRVISLVAKEYGYKGQEIAEYLWRDPASITGYARERKEFETDIEKVHDMLGKRRSKFNN